jgi:hypothetical protein
MTDNEIWLKKYSEKLLTEVGIKKGKREITGSVKKI